jgi:hypothetical protein
MSRAPEVMPCPTYPRGGAIWHTCHGDSHVPVWLADPDIDGEEAACSWGWAADKSG